MQNRKSYTPYQRRLLFTLGSAGGLLGGLLLLARCFNPVLPACSYICNKNSIGAPLCPDEYECRADGYCHLLGSSEACPYTMDLSPAPDLHRSVDMSVGDAAADM